MLLIIDLCPRLHCYPHRLLLAMLQMQCYPILFEDHLYPQYHSVHYLPSLVLFVSHFLMLELMHLLQISHLELLNRLLLLLLIYYLLLFLLVLHSLRLALLQTIVQYLAHHYCLHHLLLVTLQRRCYLILFEDQTYLWY